MDWMVRELPGMVQGKVMDVSTELARLDTTRRFLHEGSVLSAIFPPLATTRYSLEPLHEAWS